MKKLLFALAMPGAAVAFSSCENENNDLKNPVGQTINIIAKQDANATRVQLIDEIYGHWENGDAIGIFIDGENVNNLELTTGYSGATTTFNGTLIPSLGDGNYTMYAYYPHATLGNSSNAANTLVEIPEVQYPAPASFDRLAAILYANPSTLTVSGGDISPVNTRFNYAVAVAKFVFHPDVLAMIDGEPVKRFKITTLNDIAGKVELDLTTGNFGSFTDGSTSIEAVYTTPLNIAGGEAVYICLAPTTLAGMVIIEAETDSYTVWKTIDFSLAPTTFTAGKIKTVTITDVNTEIPTDLNTPVVWDFTTFTTNTTLTNLQSVDGSTGRLTTTVGTFTASTVSNNANNNIQAAGWAENDAWVMTIPIISFTGGDIKVSYKTQSSGTGPRDFEIEWSTDKQNWNSGNSYTILGNCSGSNYSGISNNINVNITVSGVSNYLYIRARVNSSISARAGMTCPSTPWPATDPVQTGGTNRISGMITVEKSIAAPSVLAEWSFSTCTTPATITNYSATTGSGTITLETTGSPTGSFSAMTLTNSANNYLNSANWPSSATIPPANVGKGAWVMEIPATTSDNGNIQIAFNTQSSGTGPKDFAVEWSVDNITWNSATSGGTYSLNNIAAMNVTATMTVSGITNKLYLRIRATTYYSARAGTGSYSPTESLQAIGTNRLTGKVTVTK